MTRLLEIFRQPWEMSIHLMEQHLSSPMIMSLTMLLLQSFLLLLIMARLVGERRC
jgi:CHASE1-domain containing sensor protein